MRATPRGEPVIGMVARTLAASAARRPAALGAACALVPPVMATAAGCSASDPLYPRRWEGTGRSLSGLHCAARSSTSSPTGWSARHPSNGGFTESAPESLERDFRRDRLVAEVFRHFEEEAGLDVVAMQEVDHYDELEAEMRRRGYEGTRKAKPDSPCLRFNADLEDGCALFWRTDAVAADELTTVNANSSTSTARRRARRRTRSRSSRRCARCAARRRAARRSSSPSRT